MNNTFDMNRFGLLIRKQWLEYGKLYLIVLAIVTGILCTIYGFIYWQIADFHGNPYTNRSLELNFRFPLFILFGILFLSLSANHYFAPLGQKSKATLELTIPASAFEKFITGILYSSIFALVSYLIIFCLVDLAFVSRLRELFPTATSNINYNNSETLRKVPEYFLLQAQTVPLINNIYFAGPILLSSIFLLGSLYFKKFQYIKTIITIMILFGIWLTIQVNSSPFFFKNKIATNNHQQLDFSPIQIYWIVTAVLLFLASMIWTIAYLRFKEKEV